MKLNSNDRTIREILNSYFFLIPRYQRPYSWDTDQIEELWEDAVRDAGGDYFIGAMVVYQKGEDTVGVIDGQQRLTTLLMLLSAIRNAAEETGNDALANGTHTFIERRDENDELRFVLKSETSNPFLHDRILSRHPPELAAETGREEDALEDAFARLSKKVAALVDSVKTNPAIADKDRSGAIGDALRDVRDKVLGLRLIFVLVADQDDATTIFVTLNSRGKNLEPGDLVKAHLLQLLPARNQVDAPRMKWERIVDLFDAASPRVEMTEFLLHSWNSRYLATSAKKLHKAVKKEVKRANAGEFLDQLGADASYFLHASDPDTRRWSREATQAAESLRFFRDFGIRQPMPLLLALVRSHEQRMLSVRMLARALRSIEDYVFSWTTLAKRSSSGGMSMLYGRFARDVLHAADTNARGVVVGKLCDELRGRRPTDVEFEEGFGSLWFTNDRTSDKRTVQYALKRIYVHYSPGAAIDFGHMTIEHLQPQSAAMPNSGRIGNLIYVTDALNAALDDKAWPAKRRLLADVEDQWIPPEVKAARSWNDASIDKRTRALATLARGTIWVG